MTRLIDMAYRIRIAYHLSLHSHSLLRIDTPCAAKSDIPAESEPRESRAARAEHRAWPATRETSSPDDREHGIVARRLYPFLHTTSEIMDTLGRHVLVRSSDVARTAP